MDTSTLNLERLRKLPTYKLPPTYRLQRDPGNGCFMDPPGFPSYFTRSVYTQHGNSPRRGPETVIVIDGVNYVVAHSDDWKPGDTWAEVRDRRDKRLRSLWQPLPVDHPRTRAWILSCYSYFENCYHDANATGSDKTVIFPVPSYKLRTFFDDPRFSDDWREKEQAAVRQQNAEIVRAASLLCTLENHKAVRTVRKYYPDYEPEQTLIDHPPTDRGGNWWETEAEQPTPETCKPRSCGPHPVNGSWCQWCGWHAEKEA